MARKANRFTGIPLSPHVDNLSGGINFDYHCKRQESCRLLDGYAFWNNPTDRDALRIK